MFAWPTIRQVRRRQFQQLSHVYRWARLDDRLEPVLANAPDSALTSEVTKRIQNLQRGCAYFAPVSWQAGNHDQVYSGPKLGLVPAVLDQK